MKIYVASEITAVKTILYDATVTAAFVYTICMQGALCQLE